MESHIDDGFEASVSAALPAAPTIGNTRNGFQVELDDGTHVQITTDGSEISRQIDLEGADFPLNSEVQYLSLIHI